MNLLAMRFSNLPYFNSIKVQFELSSWAVSSPFCYFNSIKVQFEHRYFVAIFAAHTKFQFHKGTI